MRERASPEPEPERDVASLLRTYRRRARLTQEELAQLSGLSVRTVRNLERARTRPYRDSLRRLAGALRLPAEVRDHLERIAGRRTRPPDEDDGGGGAAAPPNQLPPDAGEFTGRAREVALLAEALTAERTAGPGVAVVSGRAGVGKTALAVHVAHGLRAAFPDGQLFANLRGTDASAREPAEVLSSFLYALGMDGRAIPEGLDARLELYRLRLAGRRALVVLDDAASEAQVRPLLPGGPACAVLVTARAGLPGLIGARRVELDMLAPDDAVELLSRVTGPDRAAAEPAAAREIVRLCDRLPLAVRIAGARLSARPHWPLARLAERLLDERHRLDELVQGDLEVRASIELSYRGLAEPERRVFRRLGLLDAPDVASWVAGPLLDLDPAVAEELVERLRDAQLLETAGAGAGGETRFRLHDLLRLYARERVAAEDPPEERAAALGRALDAWRARAEAAERRFVGGGGAPGADPLAWFESERLALAAAVRQACAAGLDDVATDLAAAMASFCSARGAYDEWRRTHELVLATVRRTGNRRAEAVLLRGLGDLHTIQDRYDEALDCLSQARALFHDLGDRRGESVTLHGIGFILRLRGGYEGALACFQSALAIATELDVSDRVHAMLGIASVHLDEGRLDVARTSYLTALAEARAAGYGRGTAAALRSLAVVEREEGRFDAAEAALDRSLALHRELGIRPGEMHVLLQLGELRLRQGRLREARDNLERCLAWYREAGDRFNEALALRALGEVALAGGDPRAAAANLQQALGRFEQLGAPLWRARTQRSLAALASGPPHR
jgi:tetratricopeptide (TPR) repeat protein/transcriptional regulator with XRE-family HTH domain